MTSIYSPSHLVIWSSYCIIVLLCRFGVPVQNLQHPEAEWEKFVIQINDLNDAEPMIWSPQTQVLAKWIDMKQLTTMYAPLGAGGKPKECVIA
jgi:hypothetical protein